MSNQIIYRGYFDNTQVAYSDNPTAPNTGDEQRCIISIFDREPSVTENPYNVYMYVDDTIGDNEQLLVVGFSGLPADATATIISYSPVGAGTYTNNTGGTGSPRQWIIPFGSYDYRFTVVRPGGDEVYDIFADREIELELAERPIVIEVVDNDEDKYTPIRSKQLQIQIHSSSDIDISTFSSGGDNRWYVEYAIGDTDQIVFSGFLSISDLRMTFQANPNVITMIATDGLGFLKDIPISDVDGVDFSNENKLIDYIAGALVKTGLQLQITTEMNIREVDYAADMDGHFYNTLYVDALTFEKSVSEFEDCYTVLEKILGEMCELTQEKNRWYIRRIHEIEGNTSHPRLMAVYGYTGDFLENLEDTEFDKEIGSDMSVYDMHPMNEDTEIFTIRPYKSVRHNYNYDTPQEMPCNSEFIRGDVIDDSDPLDITYELDCWTLREGVPGHYGTVDGTTATIHRIFNDVGYEEEKYIVLTPRTTFETSSIDDVTYIESQPIPIEEKDKFTASIDFRLATDVASGTSEARVFRFVLHGSDNSWWILGEDVTGDGVAKWFNTSNWTVNTAQGETIIDFNLDDTEWRTISWEAAPAPVSGDLYIWINQLNQLNDASDDVAIWFNNLNFTYVPFINGSYRAYEGQYHISEQDEDYKAIREKEVFISDAPKKLFKGCLLKYNGSDYVKTDGFFDYWVYPVDSPSTDYTKPYGQIQNEDVWNQYNRGFVGLEGTMDGLDTNKLDSNFMPDLPGFMHCYYFRDPNTNTINKVFKLLHFQQDNHLCEWEFVLVEVFDTTISKTYTGHTFKYLESDR